jgi:hypothetical protein
MTGIFTPAYPVSKRTGSDGEVTWRGCVGLNDGSDLGPKDSHRGADDHDRPLELQP